MTSMVTNGLLFLLAVASLSCIASGQPQPNESRVIPPGGKSLLPEDPFSDVRLSGQAKIAQTSVVNVEGQPFAKALRVETTQRTSDVRAVAVEIPLVGEIKNDDVLHIRYYVRATAIRDESGLGRFAAQISQLPQRPPAAALAKWGTCGEQWSLIDVPIPGSRITTGPGQSSLTLFFGGTQPQVLEFGGIEVLNFGKDFDVRTLPYVRETYAGREPDAPWRKEAEARIEQHRKGDLTVRVVDADGKPVPGAKVHVRMTRHAYGFGTALNWNKLLGNKDTPAEEVNKYREEFLRLFNMGIPANELKWQPYEDWPSDKLAARMIDWLEQNGKRIRGHTLVWPSAQHLPARVKPMLADRESLQKEILKRIEDLVGRYKGRLEAWDVINEPVDHHQVMDIVGMDGVAEWFRVAQRADPDARLFINENNILSGAKLGRILKLISDLREKGVEVKLLGAQGHVGAMPIARILQTLDRIAEAGLRVEITEFDIVTPDEELQADFTRDLMIAVFSHPASDAFCMWGFWDGAHWLNDAPIFYRDWEMKPSGRMYEELVLKRWWTDETVATDADGVAKVRGFLGDYEIRLELPDGGGPVVKAKLAKEGTAVEIKLGQGKPE